MTDSGVGGSEGGQGVVAEEHQSEHPDRFSEIAASQQGGGGGGVRRKEKTGTPLFLGMPPCCRETHLPIGR